MPFASKLFAWPVIQFFAFDVVWFVCAISSPKADAWFWSALVSLPFTAATVLAVRDQRLRLRTAFGIAVASLLGFAVDSILFSVGYFVQIRPTLFTNNDSVAVSITFAPAWLLFLWMAFASTLFAALSWLKGRPLLTILLGSVAGPFSYWAGSAFGAFTASGSWLWLAIVWAPLLWVLIRITEWVDRSLPAGPSDPISTNA